MCLCLSACSSVCLSICLNVCKYWGQVSWQARGQSGSRHGAGRLGTTVAVRGGRVGVCGGRQAKK